MPIRPFFDRFSRRNAPAPENLTGVWPKEARVQLIYTVLDSYQEVLPTGIDAIDYTMPKGKPGLRLIVEALRGSFARGRLLSSGAQSRDRTKEPAETELVTFLEQAPDDEVTDAVEIICAMCQFDGEANGHEKGLHVTPAEFHGEVNDIMRRYGIGFHYDTGLIGLTATDTPYERDEIHVPALGLLAQPQFQNAREELAKAEMHYRAGNYRETVSFCASAFESTLKVICGLKGWSYEPTAAASKLIEIVETNGLFKGVDALAKTYLTGLRSILQSGLPTPRNKAAAHGYGEAEIVIEPRFAKFILNQT